MQAGLLGAVATLAILASGAATPAQAQIHVATAGPITGEYAAFGQQIDRVSRCRVDAHRLESQLEPPGDVAVRPFGPCHRTEQLMAQPVGIVAEQR